MFAEADSTGSSFGLPLLRTVQPRADTRSLLSDLWGDGSRISRKDVADFLVAEALGLKLSRQTVNISE